MEYLGFILGNASYFGMIIIPMLIMIVLLAIGIVKEII